MKRQIPETWRRPKGKPMPPEQRADMLEAALLRRIAAGVDREEQTLP
jgi:hypothetical protein